jgi:RimJ/RimL family protein N-acetyltransferase
MTSRQLARLHLEGEHVLLRPHRAEDDRAAFALLAGRAEILRWLLWSGPTSVDELREHYRTWQVHDTGRQELRLAIVERAGGLVAGSMALRSGLASELPGQDGATTADIGYWIGTPFQGRGLGRESIGLLAHLAFRHLGTHALHAWVFVGNLPSRRVLEHNGFTLVRTVPRGTIKDGRAIDEWQFVLLERDWRRLRREFRCVRVRAGVSQPGPRC